MLITHRSKVHEKMRNFFTLDTVKKLETQINARNLGENSTAIIRVGDILGRIGYHISTATPEKYGPYLTHKLAANYELTTRCWESSPDGLVRMGLKIWFKTEKQEHFVEIVRVKFNSAESDIMLLKGGENARTEVRIWNSEGPEAKKELLDAAFLKVEEKLHDMARRVAQHEINKAIKNHLADKHNGYVKDALLIPSRGICVLEDLIKVRNEGENVFFLVGENFTKRLPSLQGAVDFAISSFEKKYFSEEAKKDDWSTGLHSSETWEPLSRKVLKEESGNGIVKSVIEWALNALSSIMKKPVL